MLINFITLLPPLSQIANNYLQNDRTKPTIYKQEKQLLSVDKNNVYNLEEECIHSIDKNSIDKLSIEENSLSTTTTNNLYELVERNFGRTLSPIEIQKIDEWSLSFDEEIINYAISIATLNNKRTFNYVNVILKNWKTAGYKTLQEIKDNEEPKRRESTLTEEQQKALDELSDYNWLEDDSWEDEK